MSKNSSKSHASDQDKMLSIAIPLSQGFIGGNSSPAEGKIMSKSEREIMAMILPPAAPLPYPTHPLKMAYGPDDEEFEIPEEDRQKVLEDLYPFQPVPALDDLRFDIHEQKCFRVREYRVIREQDRNMLTSPYFPHSGGMVVDWMPPEQQGFGQSIRPVKGE